MGQPTNTFDSYDASAKNREQLHDVIVNIAPTKTPFQMAVGKGKAKGKKEEWLEESLDSFTVANAVVEGDDATMDAVVAPSRFSNVTQIMDKTFTISGTQEVIDKAGSKSEIAHSLMNKGKSLKRDIEYNLCQFRPGVVGNPGTSTAAVFAGFPSWLNTNALRGAGAGAPSTYSSGMPTAVFPGTQRALTEALVTTVIRTAFENGGEPTIIMVSPAHKVAFSGFAGVGQTRFVNTEDAMLATNIDVYRSDFGTHKLVANRFSSVRDLYLIDPEMVSVLYLRGFRQWELAKTGDTTKYQLLVELTLKVNSEKAHGAVFDLL